MSNLKASDVYLVGSMAVPSDTVEEAMGVAAAQLGSRLSALPDGEVGKRGWWVAGLGEITYSKHPQLEQRQNASGMRVAPPKAPDADGTVEEGAPLTPWFPTDMGLYHRKEGVTRVDLEGYLPYADAARSSYEVFKKLKASGDLAEDVRFQVDIPTPNAAIYPFFSDLSDWPEMMAAWQRAATDEIDKILKFIPAEELALQWDYCTELVGILRAAIGDAGPSQSSLANTGGSFEKAFAQYTSPQYIGALSDHVPDEVRFGYHMCLGTFPKFPAVAITDLELVVRITNEVVKNTPHRVDFLHLPSIANADRDFFAPLADLKIGDAKVFLGVAHRDGQESIAARARLAREFLPHFGISHYCGYGRDDRHHFSEMLAELKGAADILASDPV